MEWALGWDAARFLLEVVLAVIAALTASLAFFRRALSEIRAHMEAADDRTGQRVEHLEGRLTRLEVSVEALPSAQSLEEVRRQVMEVRGDIKRVDSEIRATAQVAGRIDLSLQRIETFLLNAGPRP